MSRTEKIAAEQAQILDMPYSIRAHQRIAEAADLLAQAVLTELRKQGVRKQDVDFEVWLHLRAADTDDVLPIQAIKYDINHDHEAEIQRANAVADKYGLSGYARFSETWRDAAFRIFGKSTGYFRGGWIEYDYKERYAELHEGAKPTKPITLHALVVKGTGCAAPSVDS